MELLLKLRALHGYGQLVLRFVQDYYCRKYFVRIMVLITVTKKNRPVGDYLQPLFEC